MVADIKSERWPASRRNGWPASVGIRSDTRLGQWLRGLLTRAHANTAVVALAAKMARIVWALLRHGRVYEPAAVAA